MNSTLGRKIGLALGAVVIALVALGIGYIAPNQPAVALGVALAVFLLGITAAEPAALALVAMPLSIATYRVGGGSLNLALSDVAIAIATAAALIFAPRPFSKPMRSLLWLNFIYQFATLFTVIWNPFTANTVEWFHAWMLISGSLLVGWTIGSRGHARLGLNLLLAACFVLAAITIFQGVLQWSHGDHEPIYVTWPYFMHKNMVGCVMGFAAAIVFARPPFLGWPRRWAGLGFGVFSLALLFTQSRQAIVALGLVLIYLAYRMGMRGRGLVPFVVIPVLIFVFTLVQDQVQSDNRFNSANQRLAWFNDAFAAWQEAPWSGLGLRAWYRADRVITFQPPNAELEVLVAAGVIGAVAFLIWQLGSLGVLHAMPKSFGSLAVAMVASRLIQGQFDLFWVAVQTSIPYLVVGICVGAASLAQEADPWQLHFDHDVETDDVGLLQARRVQEAAR